MNQSRGGVEGIDSEVSSRSSMSPSALAAVTSSGSVQIY